MDADRADIFCHCGPFDEHQQSIIDQILVFKGDILSLGEVVPYWATALYYLSSGRHVYVKRSPKSSDGYITLTIAAPDTDLNVGRMHDLLYGLQDEQLTGYISYDGVATPGFTGLVERQLRQASIRSRFGHGRRSRLADEENQYSSSGKEGAVGDGLPPSEIAS